MELYQLDRKISVPPAEKKCGQQQSKHWRTIWRIRANNLGVNGNNFTKLVHVVCHKAGMKIWVHIFGGLHP